MNKFPRNYWCNKYIFTILFLGMSLLKTNAQNSFFYECESDFSQDIFEDDNGCIVVLTEDRIIRLSPYGSLLWESWDNSLVNGFNIKDSQSYIFSATSSEMGGFGMASYDYKGKRVWGKYLSPLPESRFIEDFIHDSVRHQYIVAGDKYKVGEFNKPSYWIAGVDYHGNIIWENFWRDTIQGRYFKRIFKNKKTKGYFLLTEDADRDFPYELMNVDSLGKLINRNPLEPNPCTINVPSPSDYTLIDIRSFNDTMFIASIVARTSCPDPYGTYFYLYNSQGKLIKRIYSQDANGVMFQTRDNGLITGAGIYIAKLNENFELKWAKNILPDKEFEAIYIKKITQSKDGGYLGIADGYRAINNNWSDRQYVVYVFKTDTNGLINQQIENNKLESAILQPNPANTKVRIAIPNYFGKITAQFYNVLGVFLFEKTIYEDDMYDISSLSSGMYTVKARLEETGEMRTMKLVVQ